MEHVTREEIIAAATRLLRKYGSIDRVTLAGVRENLGNRGSWSTITPIVQQWKARLAASRTLVDDADVVIVDKEGRSLKIVEPGGVQAEVDSHGRLTVVIRVECG